MDGCRVCSDAMRAFRGVDGCMLIFRVPYLTFFSCGLFFFFFDAATHARLSVEARETLELLVNWCDLCLPANEQSFAEANRIKIQDFEVSYYEITSVCTSRGYRMSRGSSRVVLA